MKTTLLLATLAFLNAPHSFASEGAQLSRIASLPAERCQMDLRKLRDIHGQMRNMNDEQRELFLRAIAEDIRARGLQLPPPPGPCTQIHLALERRCGDEQEARSRCR